MDKCFIPKNHEESIYNLWEKQGLLKPTKGIPYTILMPPPNANASLHAGHGMYVIEDIMIRYKRLQGCAALWIPGMDHAGFETQYVYEKQLAKKHKSRRDFDRNTLYQNIYQFVQENSGLIYKQFKHLGFLADWNRSVFSLDIQVIKRVFKTFKKMESEGLVYKDNYIVNYCPHCGTSLAELEVEHVERNDPLYYLKYGPFVLATVRPETKFGDTAIAVHPEDKRYQKWIGQEIEVTGLIGKFKIRVIADNSVDPKFGTGVVKITPAHDHNDFETGKRHGLKIKKVIDINGRLNQLTGPYAGLKVKAARKRIVEDLQQKGLIEKIDNKYSHSVIVCYKCGRDLEPTIMPNWFIKVKELKKPIIKAVKENKVKFYPKKYKQQMLQWLEIMHDWPISRQIAWGIRIPIWYKINGNENKIWVNFLDKQGEFRIGNLQDHFKNGFSLIEIKKGLQQVIVPFSKIRPVEYIVSDKEPDKNKEWIQETDTFDTWFSSSQWPLVTLKDNEFKTLFPTDFMGTLADILKFWISRMLMFSLYLKKEIPFKDVYLWSMVTDAKGKKMSKSKGNVVNPIELVNKYGADAFRASLIFGVGQGGKVNLAENKVKAMRNYANKIWNIGRFIKMNQQSSNLKFQKSNGVPSSSAGRQMSNSKIVIKLNQECKVLEEKYHQAMNKYQFSQAFDDLYEFIWHRLADYYIEELKEELRNDNIKVLENLKAVYLKCLKLLHPFMPFVTEAIYQEFEEKKSILLVKLKTNE